MSHPWWKTAVVYQVWPASFKDSNGDGIGDIQGLISKLPYLKDLGVDVVWLSPMYDSPQIDMGYDVADYESVYAPYGTLGDMDHLIQACHSQGLRLILDLVINHTSDHHAWFRDSRSSKESEKRDWYIWRPPRYVNGVRKAPTNWRANVGGSAWEWDETTQEYYFHLFSPEQPDLNWDCDRAREAIHKSAVTFWLDKGVDGFRIDTCNLYSKDMTFPDAPISDPTAEFQPAADYFANGPRMHEFMREIVSQAFAGHDVMSVGELPHTHTAEKVLMYVRPEAEQLNMVFQFNTVTLGHGKPVKLEAVPYTLNDFKMSLEKQQNIANLGGWTTSFLENHDQGRSISRFGSQDPQLQMRSGKMLAILLVTLTGTLFIYQGQEIGMLNMPPEWEIKEYKDLLTIDHYKAVTSRHYADEQSREAALARAMGAIQDIARDHSRTPVQWDDSHEGGFTNGTPWTRVHDNYHEINVKRQNGDHRSLLTFWKQAIEFRKSHFELLGHGYYQTIEIGNPNVVACRKRHGDSQALAVMNFSDHNQNIMWPDELSDRPTLIALSNLDEDSVLAVDMLRPWEGRIYL